jgi:hypothetical protein
MNNKYLLFPSLLLPGNAVAQKLPNPQIESLRAPENIKLMVRQRNEAINFKPTTTLQMFFIAWLTMMRIYISLYRQMSRKLSAGFFTGYDLERSASRFK